MKRIFRLLTLSLSGIVALSIPSAYSNYSKFILFGGDSDLYQPSKHVIIHDTVLLNNQRVDGFKTDELSDIAWDEQQNILYAVTDKGKLFHLSIDIHNKQFVNASIQKGYRLKDKKDKKLKKKWRDAEGLSLYKNDSGETELLLSFETHPRIKRYSVEGKYIKGIKIPKKLSRIKSYKSPNKALESVAFHPKHGILTAAERPLVYGSKHIQTIYAMDGKYWMFDVSPLSKSSVTSIEVLEDGNLLILERAWAGMLSPINISLRLLKLNGCKSGSKCPVRELALLSSADGWRLDNFEGLTHYKDNLYLMISDNNEHPLQKSLLTLFELKNI